MSGGQQLTLQVNNAGAWKNVVAFDRARKPEVLGAVSRLAGVLPDAKWCLLSEDGKRDWIKAPGVQQQASMRTLNRALDIADAAVRSEVECYAHGEVVPKGGIPGWPSWPRTVYDLTRPLDTGHGQTEESMALQVQIAQRAADHIRSRPAGTFPWHLREVDGTPHLVWFEDR